MASKDEIDAKIAEALKGIFGEGDHGFTVQKLTLGGADGPQMETIFGKDGDGLESLDSLFAESEGRATRSRGGPDKHARVKGSLDALLGSLGGVMGRLLPHDDRMKLAMAAVDSKLHELTAPFGAAGPEDTIEVLGLLLGQFAAADVTTDPDGTGDLETLFAKALGHARAHAAEAVKVIEQHVADHDPETVSGIAGAKAERFRNRKRDAEAAAAKAAAEADEPPTDDGAAERAAAE